MDSLDDRVGGDEGEPQAVWTPWRGLVRGAIRGAIAAVVLAALLAPVAWFVPQLALHWGLGAAIALGVAWVLFGVVQRAAGMAGTATTAMVIVFTLLVLGSQNAVVAVHGVPASTGVVTGWMWRTPLDFAISGLASFVTIAFCAALRHNGGGGIDTLTWILTLPVRGRMR